MLANRVLVAVLAMAAAAPAVAQGVSDTSLSGTWLVGGSRFNEAFTFVPGGEFQYSYVTQRSAAASAVQVKAVTRSGAFKAAQQACSLGERQGNLWLALDSSRCCYVAYFVGSALVLDAVRAPNAVPGGLCDSKTLRRW